jgi:hypothetical protein
MLASPVAPNRIQLRAQRINLRMLPPDFSGKYKHGAEDSALLIHREILQIVG